MRLGVLVAVLTLFAACSSGGDGPDAVDETKSEMDQLVGELLPDLAEAGNGEFPRVQGMFLNCQLGHTRLKYDVDGEVHGTRPAESAVGAMATVAEEHGFDVVEGPADLTFVAEAGEVTLRVEAYDRPVGGKTVSVVTLDTDCTDFTSEAADRALSLPTEVYGAPLRPQG